MRARFETVIRAAQDSICARIEAVEAAAAAAEGAAASPRGFRQDAWTRDGGGGGVTRVLQGGRVFEKAGVNVSVVFGSMPPEAYRAATGKAQEAAGAGKAPAAAADKNAADAAGASPASSAGRVPFFAAGISSVMHPLNPHAPTMHFNYRYFETEAWNGLPAQWWFGGGTDITPSYLYEEDMLHFHGSYKTVCDRHDPAFYPRFKQWADDYFLIGHRGERRGLGGIFFDDLNDRPAEELLAFATDAVGAVSDAYVPLVERRADQPFTEREREWQQLRRGRYVEFNLVYDRGTTFGLKTGGRIESILMSLPLTARWEYDADPPAGTPEAELVDCCRNPRTWV